MDQIIEHILYYLVRGLAFIIQSLPISASLAAARFFGNIAYLIDKRRAVAYANVKAALGNHCSAAEISSIVRKAYVHFAQMLVEVLYFPKMDQAYMDKYIEISNAGEYETAMKSGKGVMALTAHFGNWEMLQLCSALKGHPLHLLVHEQKMGRLDQYLNELRSRHEAKPIYTKGMEIRNLIRALRDGEAVGVLGDQGGGKNGVRINFFGRTTTSPTGIFSIAAKTDAIVIPAFCMRKSGPYHQIEVTAPLHLVKTGNEEADERENSQMYLDRLQEFIRRKPENWLWMHKRWKFRFTKKAIVLHDEKAGHASQAQSIASAMQKISDEFGNDPLQTEHIQVKFKNKTSQILFFISSLFLAPLTQGRLSLLRYFLSDETTKQIEKIQYADFVISSGSKLVALNLWLSNEFLAKKVVIMKPPFPYTLFRYDLLVLPKHDHYFGMPSPQVRTFFAPNLATSQLLEESKAKLKNQLTMNGSAKVAVFIGGKSKTYRFDPSKLKVLLGVLREEAERSDLDLMITTSRRTEQEFEKMIKENFSDHPKCKLLVIANEKNIENVTYGMLGLSDIAVVTEDSVSMISEAVSSRKNVIVAEIGNDGLSAKHKRFKQILADERFIRVAAPAQLRGALNQAQGTGSVRELIQAEEENLRAAIWRLL